MIRLFIVLLIISSVSVSTSFAQDTPIIVVELFTSEGCSSCPPADRLLSEIIKKESSDVAILALSFHVDYWDYIGWRDPYAASKFTSRQRGYARVFQNNSIYTPQMVVNGKHEFVGSSRSDWNTAYEKEKGFVPKTILKLTSVSLNKKELQFAVSSQAIERSIVNVAVVERELSQEVTRGENRGRMLSHDNVVRAFDSRQFDGRSNQFVLTLPSDLDISNASLIVYSQDQSTWQITAAQKLELDQID